MIVGQHVTFILMKPFPLHCFKLKDFEYCCMLANLVSRSQLPKWQMNTHKVTSRNTTFWQKDNTVTPTFPLWHCFTALIFKKILTAYVSCTYSVHTLTFLYISVEILTSAMTGSIHHCVASFSFSFNLVSSLFCILWRLNSKFHLYVCDFSFFNLTV